MNPNVVKIIIAIIPIVAQAIVAAVSANAKKK